MLLDEGVVELHVAGLDGELAAFRHRVSCVERQVQDDLFELPRIGAHVFERRVQRRHQRDVFADQALQERLSSRHHLIEIEHLRLQDLLAAEGQQLLREQRGAFAGPPHLLDVATRRVGGLEIVEHEVAVAEDGGQQVVEVVRHPAGQAAHRLHFARLLQLLFEGATRLLHLRAHLQVVDQALLRAFDLVRPSCQTRVSTGRSRRVWCCRRAACSRPSQWLRPRASTPSAAM